jgi:hypothetical protein
MDLMYRPSLRMFSTVSGALARSTCVPAHLENGQRVPGTMT